MASIAQNPALSNGWYLGTLMAINPHIEDAQYKMSSGQTLCLPDLYNSMDARFESLVFYTARG